MKEVVQSVTLVFLTGVLFGCASKSEKQDDFGRSMVSGKTTEVKTVVAKIRPFEFLISTPGTAASAKEAIVQSRSQGIIKRVFVGNNDGLQVGQTILELDNELEKLQLEKASVLLKEKQLLFDDQMIGFKQRFDSSRLQIASENIRVSSGLKAAEINFKEAEYNFMSTFVKAPVGGIVSDLALTSGNPVTTNQIICKIHDPSQMTVLSFVLEEDATRIAAGMNAVVSPVASPETKLRASVFEVNPRVDEKSKMVRVTLTLGKEGRDLFPGMHVRVVIGVPYEKHIIVPKAAVVLRSGRSVIFTSKGKVAKWNYVTIGSENGVDVEVLEGLTDGDSVIVSNNLQLAHGTPLTIDN